MANVPEIYRKDSLVYFKNVRDQSTIAVLARQLSPSNTAALLDAYKRSTREPHSYLLIDLNQKTTDLARFRSSVFPKDASVFVSQAAAKNLGRVSDTHRELDSVWGSGLSDIPSRSLEWCQSPLPDTQKL